MSKARTLKSLAVAGLLALGSLGLGACGDDKDSDANPLAGLIQVTGTVTELTDQTTFDGGVTIRVSDSERGNLTLWFESLFTSPPPTPERLALYQEIRKVSVGNTIRATARPDGTTSYKLESITVVTPG